jgi:hypothetical protein
MNTVSDASPIPPRSTATIFAGSPIVFHISIRLKCMPVPLSPRRYAVNLNGIWMIRYTVIGCPL